MSRPVRMRGKERTLNMTISERLIKEIVLEEGALAHVFERFGIDYCCHGDESLAIACERKGLSIELVVSEMDAAKSARPYSFLHCDLWSEDFLIQYIVENHHRYCKATMPV